MLILDNGATVTRALAFLSVFALASACGGGGGGANGSSADDSSSPPPSSNPSTGDESPAEPDELAPGTLQLAGPTEATMHSLTFLWTATGDDGDQGAAERYDFFLSSNTPPCNLEPCRINVADTSPRVAGELEALTVRPLVPGQDFKLLVQAFDEAGNFSNQLAIDGRTLDDTGWQLVKLAEVDTQKIRNVWVDSLAMSEDGKVGITWVTYPLEPIGSTSHFTEWDGQGWTTFNELIPGVENGYRAGVGVRYAPDGEPALFWVESDDLESNDRPTRHRFLKRDVGQWGTPEIIDSGGGIEAGGLVDSVPFVTYVKDAPRAFYTVTPTLTPEFAEYTLVTKEQIAPGTWGEVTELLTCPSFPRIEGGWTGNPFSEPLALTLPADPIQGLPERALYLAVLERGYLAVSEDGSGDWSIRHTGAQALTEGRLIAAEATADGSITMLIRGRADDSSPYEIGLMHLRVGDLPILASNCELPPSLSLPIEWFPDLSSDGSIDATSFSTDESGTYFATITWQDSARASDLTVHAQCNGQWNTEVIDRIPDSPARGPLLDSDGNPVLAYSDGRLGELYVVRREGTPCM